MSPTRSTLPILLTFSALAVFLLVGVLVSRPAEAQTSGCSSDTHQPSTDPEVLVLTTATRLPQLCARRGLEIFNNGPNTIWCAVSANSAHARVNRARPIAAGTSWGVDAKDIQPIWCVAATASQVQGAATIVSEMR